jgi:hypothetical protein
LCEPTLAQPSHNEFCLLQQSSLFRKGFGFFWWNDYGGGYFVVGVEVQEFYALGAAACGANALGVDADDFAELADDHHLAGLVDEVDAGDLAVLGRGLDVDDALAAAGLEAVLVDVGALAVAVLGDREDEAGREAELLVEFFELGRGLFGEDRSGELGWVAGELERCGGSRLGGEVDGCFDLVLETLGGGEFEALLVAGLVGRSDRGADDVVALLERDAAVTGGRTTHRPEVLLVEADGHAVVGGEEDDLLAVGDAGGDELVVLLDVDGDDAARHHVGEVLQRGLLHRAVASGEENVLVLFGQVADGEDGNDFFAGLQRDERGHGLALACGADVGNLIHLEPVDAAGVGEAEEISVRRVDDELGDEVLFAGLHAETTGASATLLTVDGDGRALEIAGIGDGDGDLLVGDKVFEGELGGFVEDLSAAGIAVLVADLFEFLDDDFAELLLGGKDRLILFDVAADFGKLFQQLIN